MPIVNMPLDTLLRLINADGNVIGKDDVADKLHDMGVEVEERAAIKQFRCNPCGRIIERTEAQGDPLNCPNCGTDYRENASAVSEIGVADVLRLDMLAVRPDIFDAGGMSRYFRGFLSVETGLKQYDLSSPRYQLAVDPRLAEDSSYRPFIACAVLRNLKFDDERIKLLMNLQEDLHWALGRNRKLASIGAYDLDRLQGTNFRYDAVNPDELQFAPLGFAPEQLLTPAQILEQHKTGQAFAHLLKGFERYPLLRDEQGTVLSMPPIINSEPTRVTLDTTACFVDVTGPSQRSVDRALAIVVANLKEMMPEIEIEQVRITAADGTERVTPDLTPSKLTIDVRAASDTLGIRLDERDITSLLERMGNAVTIDQDNRLIVEVPAWRNDVMHPIDLIEDIAIAHGFENLVPEIVPTFTVGSPQPIEEHSAVVRRIFTGLGFHQVMTLTLTSEEAAFEKWRLEPDPHRVVIEHPISTAQTICRVNLLPGLLETLAINKQYDLPQRIFEVGDCAFVFPDDETGAREERFCAAAIIGSHVGYADIRAVVDAFQHEFGVSNAIEPAEHPSFIPGRVAALQTAAGDTLGHFGEVHPEVLENYGLRHPVSVVEFNLTHVLSARDALHAQA